MASLGSGNWTIAYPNGSREVDTSITNRKKIVNLKLTMASGEWPSAGIPMPGAGSLGFVRNLDYFTMAPRLATASGRSVTYTLTSGHKIRAIGSVLVSGANGRSFQPLATTITQAARIFHVTAFGW